MRDLCGSFARGDHICLTMLAVLNPQMRDRIMNSGTARDRIAEFRVMNINYYPRESHLAIFRDPWSFPTLFHPGCNNLVRRHLEELSQKVSATNP